MRGMTDNVVPLRPPKTKPEPTLAELVARVHELAKNSDNIGWSDHFRKQLLKRHKNMTQVLETLEFGDGVSKRLDEFGDWRVKLKRFVAGRRIQVVVAVRGARLSAITVI